MGDEKALNHFETSVKLMDHGRRITELEADLKTIKPIVYETANSVKSIEKSVGKMETNSDKMRGYIQGGVVAGVLAIVFFAIKSMLGIGG